MGEAARKLDDERPAEAVAGVRVRECRHGLFCYFPHDSFIGRALDWYGEYSEGEVELFSKLLKPGMVVVEAGANIGSLTVPIARMVGESGRVFAFEPQRIVHQQLCANVAMNGLWNVWTINKALGQMHGTVGVPPVDYAQEANFGGVAMVSPGSAAEWVEQVALDDLPYRPSFLKLDAEGMELDILMGGISTIRQCRPVIFCENDREEKSRDLIRWLMSAEYDLWWHVSMLFNPNNHRRCAEDFYNVKDGNGNLVRMASSNMLCVPKEIGMKVHGLRQITSPDSVWNGEG